MPVHALKGHLFVVSAPSGVGKTTLIHAIRDRCPELRFSVSCTTRPPRSGEVAGVDYHFISREEFSRGVSEGHFLEWAEVHGHFYGTRRAPIDAWLAAGRDVLFDIDVQGASRIRGHCPDAHTIFILPPSLAALKERLQRRGTEDPAQLSRRLEAAKGELLLAPWFDFAVVNDVLQVAIADLHAILVACHCLRSAQATRIHSLLDACLSP
jgi:guanylate kinase